MIPDTRLYIAHPTFMFADRFSNDGQYGYLPSKWIFTPGEAS